MSVPGAGAAAAVLDLNEPHAALDESPRRQQLRAELAAMRQVEAVQRLGFGRLLGEVDDLGHRHLHAKRQLVRSDPRGERRIVGILDAAQRVQLADQVDARRPAPRRRTVARAGRSRADSSGSMRSGTASWAGPE